MTVVHVEDVYTASIGRFDGIQYSGFAVRDYGNGGPGGPFFDRPRTIAS